MTDLPDVLVQQISKDQSLLIPLNKYGTGFILSLKDLIEVHHWEGKVAVIDKGSQLDAALDYLLECGVRLG